MTAQEYSNTINASFTGCLVPEGPWRARIVGIHDNAVSLLHPDSAFVSVVRGENRAEGRAIILDSENFSMLISRVQDHGGRLTTARMEGDTLSFPGCTVGLKGSKLWDPRPDLRKAAHTVGETRANRLESLTRLTETTERHLAACLNGESVLRDPIYRKKFLELCMERSAYPDNLAGFGPGTTPAGDDFISGFLLALMLFGRGPGNTFEPIFESISRTNAAGRALLLGSKAGVFPAHLVAFAKAFSEAARMPTGFPPFVEAIDTVLSHGATSGADALMGFLCGARGERDSNGLPEPLARLAAA